MYMAWPQGHSIYWQPRKEAHSLKHVTQLAVHCLSAMLLTTSVSAADVTARDITEALFRAGTSSGTVTYSGKDLSFLDLAGLDFKQAVLAGTNFYGSDLTQARLSGSNLAGAKLDRTSLSRADLSGANLKGATLLTVSAHATSEPNPKDAPNFSGADLSDAHIASRLDGANFTNANLSRARMGTLVPTWGSYRPRAIFNGAKFSGASLHGADLSMAVMQFTEFRNADLRAANLKNCDFTKANLVGADLSGADISGADFDGADLTGIKGFDSVIGLAEAKNLDRAVR
jgi:uncharacterized protein YjbI with pentapeptide repeats